MYVALSDKVGERMNSVKIFLVLLFTSFVFLTSCKDQGTTPPEPISPEISGIELSSEQIIVNDTVQITATLHTELGQEYKLRWQLTGYQTDIDSVTSEATFNWIAPRVHGNYEHSVQILSATGEPVSEPYLFSTEISSIPVVPVEGNKLVFSMPEQDGDNQIFSMNLDGSGLMQLTFFDNEAYSPSWSPDGRKIVFSSGFMGSSAGPALFVMDANGENIKPVKYMEDSIRVHKGDFAQWSPDGIKLVYSEYLGGVEIMVFDFETDEITQLTNAPASNSFPSWSPKSNQIVFQSRRDVHPHDSSRLGNDIYIMDKDGGNVQRLTETGSSRTPVWHPQGDIVVYRETSGSNKLMTLDVETKTTMQIEEPFEEGVFLWPMAWSSDGKSLLVQVRDYPVSNFHILELETEEVTSVPLESNEFSGMDWYQYKNE